MAAASPATRQGAACRSALPRWATLPGATSSASTKLFHGGLRYLEFFEFKLVRHALEEREILCSAPMPQYQLADALSVLPLSRDMRFDSTTPTSRLLTAVMPWMKGRRPDWLIRLGLFLYDHLGGRKILSGHEDAGTDRQRPRARRFRIASPPPPPPPPPLGIRILRLLGRGCPPCRAESARDAEERGARILTRTRVTGARGGGGPPPPPPPPPRAAGEPLAHHA